MFEILPQSSGNVIGIKVDGKLLHADYEQFIPKLEAMIAEHGSIRCYFEMSGFQGIQFRALWDETKFDVKHCRDIERCAIVGDPSWHHWMTNVGKLIFHKAQIRYFSADQSDEAWEWVNEGAKCCSCTSTCDSTTKTN